MNLKIPSTIQNCLIFLYFLLLVLADKEIIKLNMVYSSLFFGFLFACLVIMYGFILHKKYQIIEDFQKQLESKKISLIENAFETFQEKKDKARTSEFYNDLSIKLSEVEYHKRLIDIKKHSFKTFLYLVASLILLLFFSERIYLVLYSLLFMVLYYVLVSFVVMYLVLSHKK